MHNFRELKIWQEAIEIAKSTYKLSKTFPASELYGLISQINRAAVSIPSNIAEGAGRNSNKEFTHFLSIAIGSSFELETQMILAFELGYIKKDEFDTFILNINKSQKMINALKSTLKVQTSNI
ncbi:MAG: four helix bundle protein [Bacteroidetes bacterium]|nr:four helix bundle protein [Bacteroidota bacterium]